MKKQILKKMAGTAAALAVVCAAAAGGTLNAFRPIPLEATVPQSTQTNTVQENEPTEKLPIVTETVSVQPVLKEQEVTVRNELPAEEMPLPVQQEQPQMPQPEEAAEPVVFLQETPELAAQDPMAPPAEENSLRHPDLSSQLPEDSVLLTEEQIRQALDSGALEQVEEQCITFEDENCLIRWLWEWLFGKREYSGWHTVKEKTYYYSPETHERLTGIQSLDGKLCYFDEDGVLQQDVTFGIDVSKYQTSMDWEELKASGVSFVVIRIGYRGYGAEGKLVLDPMFEEHFTNARNAGLEVGVYFFSQAVNEDEAREEAFGCAYVLNGRELDLPIYFDTELSTSPTGTGRADALGVTERTDCAIAFCEEVKLNGYRPGVYASTNWFNSRVEYDRLTDYSIWNAHYGVPSSPISCDLWQGSCTVRLNGYSGQLDANIRYME